MYCLKWYRNYQYRPVSNVMSGQPTQRAHIHINPMCPLDCRGNGTSALAIFCSPIRTNTSTSDIMASLVIFIWKGGCHSDEESLYLVQVP